MLYFYHARPSLCTEEVAYALSVQGKDCGQSQLNDFCDQLVE